MVIWGYCWAIRSNWNTPWCNMTKTAIRKKKARLELKLQRLENSYWEAKKKVLQKQNELTKKCNHSNMQGGQYCRWCNDCGYSEDTT